MIEARGLTKRYDDRLAIDRLDLTVPAQSALGVLGANGAGKSTLLRMLLGLTRPTGGTLRVLGHDPVVESLTIRCESGWVPESKTLYRGMRVDEFVRFYAHFFPGTDAKKALEGLADSGLDGSARVEALSRGQRTRVVLAAVLARRPRLLLLDEPTEGLDPVAMQSTWTELVYRLGSLDTGLVLATHRVEDVERLCDRVAILDRGRLLLHADLDDLRSAWHRVHMIGPQSAGGPETWPGVVECESSGGGMTLITDIGRGFPIDRLHEIDPGTIRIHPMNLREIYLAVVGCTPEEPS
jgi:ABC-2 type transport system ATP-binding protein